MSQAASGYDRIAGDAYFTPAWVVEALKSVERFDGPVLDPGAGAGNILDHFPGSVGFDIAPARPGILAVDFLSVTAMPAGVRHVVTNPPYGKGGRLAVDFIAHALDLTMPLGGKVAMLLRVDFDSAGTRAPIFGDHPAFAAKYTLRKRIRWANLPQSENGPTENHAWYAWDWAKRPDAGRAYGYLPRKELSLA